jgi:hypothetical protein
MTEVREPPSPPFWQVVAAISATLTVASALILLVLMASFSLVFAGGRPRANDPEHAVERD